MYSESSVEIRDLKLIKKLELEMAPFRDKRNLLKSNFSEINIDSLNSQKFEFGLIKNKNSENKYKKFIAHKANLNFKKEKNV